MAVGPGMLIIEVLVIPSPKWGVAGVKVVPAAILPVPPAAPPTSGVPPAAPPTGGVPPPDVPTGGVPPAGSGSAPVVPCPARDCSPASGCSAVWIVLSSDPVSPLIEVSSAACIDLVIALVKVDSAIEPLDAAAAATVVGVAVDVVVLVR